MRSSRFSVTLLIGAPGSGKGTQAANVQKELGIPHVATGDLLRDHCRQGTDLGKTAQVYMDRGDLVPDHLVVKMVIDRLGLPDAARGVLLDGFPRTLAQAEALDRELILRGGGVETALFLDVPSPVILRRLSGRRICEGCNGSFHVDLHQLPRDGSCPTCRRFLVLRHDDQRAAVTRRISVFHEQTAPVISHYRARGVLHRVNGHQSVDKIWTELLEILQRPDPALAAS
ncbi:MAG: adenylate kinase [Chloroflexota bacterium]